MTSWMALNGSSSQAAEALALGALAGWPLEELLQSGPSQLFPKVEGVSHPSRVLHCRRQPGVSAARLLGVSGNVMRAQLRTLRLVGRARGCTRRVFSESVGLHALTDSYRRRAAV